MPARPRSAAKSCGECFNACSKLLHRLRISFEVGVGKSELYVPFDETRLLLEEFFVMLNRTLKIAHLSERPGQESQRVRITRAELMRELEQPTGEAFGTRASSLIANA